MPGPWQGHRRAITPCDYPEFVKTLPVCSETKFIADGKSYEIDEASPWVQKTAPRRWSTSQRRDTSCFANAEGIGGRVFQFASNESAAYGAPSQRRLFLGELARHSSRRNPI